MDRKAAETEQRKLLEQLQRDRMALLSTLEDQRRAEESLRESEARFRQAIASAPFPIMIHAEDDQVITVNTSWTRLTGYEHGDIPTIADWTRKAYGVKMDLVKADIYNLLTLDGPKDEGEYNITTRSGDTRIWDFSSAPIGQLPDGRRLGISMAVDITERRLAEESLKTYAEELALQRNELEKRMNESVKAISKIGELRDVYTAGHQKRVAELVCAIGREMGFADQKISNLSYGGLLHDVGKFFVPSDILNKPGKVSDLEYKILQTHVEESYNVVKEIDFPEEIHTMIYQHHERLDGSGYPQGLSGDEIILESRILAVADVVEAMSSHRPYRSALGIDAALEEIELYKGTRFDTDIVDICKRLFGEKKFQFNEK